MYEVLEQGTRKVLALTHSYSLAVAIRDAEQAAGVRAFVKRVR